MENARGFAELPPLVRIPVAFPFPPPPPPRPDDSGSRLAQYIAYWEGETKVVSTMIAFIKLSFNKQGATLANIVTYMRLIFTNMTPVTILRILQRHANIFQLTTGEGDNIEQRWNCNAFDLGDLKNLMLAPVSVSATRGLM